MIFIEEIPDLEKEVTITSDMLAGIPYDASVAGLNIGEILCPNKYLARQSNLQRNFLGT